MVISNIKGDASFIGQIGDKEIVTFWNEVESLKCEENSLDKFKYICFNKVFTF